ncbi:MAG: hypothetical protein MUC76_02215 [Spirochaetes bacterium]|jgi:NAD-dependent SIR2 family protein deacetylase|nr:hypothetical protein [Spirochaetota bacterium]
MRTLKREAHRLLPLFAEILDSFPNTDNLRQEAGSSDAIEVYGNMFRMKCLAFGRVRRFERKPVIRDVNYKGPHQGAFYRSGWIPP